MTGEPLAGFAAEVGPAGPVTCVGGRTQWGLAGVAGAGREVHAPAGIVAVEPEEMTVVVRAGTPVSELRGALAEVGQRVLLPDPGPGATVGGVLAVGWSRLDRLRWGPVRDALLQARYVSAAGQLVTAGGPTVKNVSGFDLCRLLVGSVGTLGFLAEVILRTRPVPAASAWLAGDVAPWAVRDVLYRPSSVLWDGRRTWVLVEGHPDDVRAQAALAAVHGLTPAAGPPALPAGRTSLPPGELRERAASWAPAAFVAEVGVGTVHGDVGGTPRPATSQVAALDQRIKDAFDPTGRLNPGRDPAQV